MQTLSRTFANYDLELLQIIANRWDVDLTSRDAKEAGEQLAAAMLQAARVEEVWNHLPDEQRSALQTLLGAKGKMPAAFFGRLFGTIRMMGPDRLIREKPYLNPENVAEALYYRGLIAQTFAEIDKTKPVAKGAQSVIYIPSDLAALMPAHLTGYDLAAPSEPVTPTPEPEKVRLTDTALVDDLTTLLAACQVENVPLVDGAIPPELRTQLKPYLLGSGSAARFGLMVALALDLGLAGVSEQGSFLKPVSAVARQWLDAPRLSQVRSLAEAWRSSTTYNEIWHTPGIRPERAGWQNDPRLARQTVLTFLEMVPLNGWWQVDELVEAVKENEPDFQRPDGDYDSWYIRDAQSNIYLRGFESWDKVDGAVLRFILSGPMFGLGLIDLAEEGRVCRLTAYGRALVDLSEWPPEKDASAPPEAAPIRIDEQGLCEVPRSANRYERFQLARITDWLPASDPYRYQLSAEGVERAKAQGLRTEQILTFLRRVSRDTLPENVAQQIERLGRLSAEPAILSHLMVLRVPTEEMMKTITGTPALRRYLGAPLGPLAVVVREAHWAALLEALRAHGILVETDGDEES